MSRRDENGHVIVRPRLVWAGTGICLLGMIGIGLALVSPAPAWALPGVAVMVAGAGLGWYGGIGQDVHGKGGAGRELHQVVDGGTRPGVSPADHLADDDARRDARATNERAREVLARSRTLVWHDQPHRVAALVLFVLAAWLIFEPRLLGYDMESDSRWAVLFQFAAAVGLVVCGVWLHQVGRSLVVSGLSMLIGVLLILAGLLSDATSTERAVNQIIAGTLVVLTAVVSGLPPRWSRDWKENG